MSDNTQNAWEKYPAALPKDTILAGKYIIKNVLGQGGFGITYLAEDYKKGIKVAIKEFFPETMAMRCTATLSIKTYTDERLKNFRFGMDCFLEEAKVLAHFQGNPHIVGVQTYFEENGTAYFVMDYIEGIDFKTYIKQNGGKLPWEEVCKIMLPIMDALETVHKNGIIHRDVTPDNIYISKDGRVRLLDFGAARYSLGDRSKSLDVVLKAGYAPKEQYTRRGKQGPFTDVYSTAACFYAALSGFLPPESLDRMEEDNLVPLSARGVQLPDKAEEAILKALEVRAEDRYQGMDEFRHAMFGQNPIPEPVMPDERSDEMDDSSTELQKRTPRKKRGIFIGGAAAVIIIVVMAVIGMSNRGKIKDGYNTYIYNDGGIYDGYFKDGKRNGQGRFTYTNGDIYIGLWNQDEREGTGTYHFANGDIYEGEWSHNIRTGMGTINYVNGDSYKGAWSDDRRNGQGTMNYVNGDSYEGAWKDDKRNGHGVMIYNPQSTLQIYEGDWQDDERKGQGKLVWKSGEVYEGSWENDERSGYGKGSFTNGNVYEGEWKNDDLNGKGTIVYVQDDPDGRESYEGGWLDGKRNGQGKMIWKNGQIYEGEWKNGSMSGRGKITYAQDNSSGCESYEGEWLDSKRNGQGKMIWNDGSVYEGEWKNGFIDGVGKYINANGGTYEGEYKENNWHGQGKYIWSTGAVYEGEWKNGKRDGYGKYASADGETWEGEWKDDEWVGEINTER